MYRSLVHNMVVGVSAGYTKVLELVGVGYRVSNQGNLIEFALGYTHPIFIQLPKEIKVETKSERNQNPILTLESCDKQLLGLQSGNPAGGGFGSYYGKRAGKRAFAQHPAV